MRIAAALTLVALLGGCADETISGYADRDAVYRLTEMGGAPVTASATITFPDAGRATGQGPCNAWSAAQTAPYPWFELGPIEATERGCPDLDVEAAFFAALAAARFSEVSGGVLILTDEAGAEMVFRADDT